MNAATLSHASGRDESMEVMWEDAERVFCRLLQKMPRAIGALADRHDEMGIYAAHFSHEGLQPAGQRDLPVEAGRKSL
jgi:hypothetical protein